MRNHRPNLCISRLRTDVIDIFRENKRLIHRVKVKKGENEEESHDISILEQQTKDLKNEVRAEFSV